MRTIRKIILHCTGTDIPNQDAAMIRRWHTDPPPKGRGWNDIGYHYVVKANGVLENGRPLSEIGAHTFGQNIDSVGIVLVGDKHFAPEQFDTLRLLLTRLKNRFPNATLHGHKEFNVHKTCPNYDYAPLVKFWLALPNT